jgi:hypothetical protein
MLTTGQQRGASSSSALSRSLHAGVKPGEFDLSITAYVESNGGRRSALRCVGTKERQLRGSQHQNGSRTPARLTVFKIICATGVFHIPDCW